MSAVSPGLPSGCRASESRRGRPTRRSFLGTRFGLIRRDGHGRALQCAPAARLRCLLGRQPVGRPDRGRGSFSACSKPDNKTVKARGPNPARPRPPAETLPCRRRRGRTWRSGVALPPHDVGRGAHQRRKRPADLARQHSHGAQAHGARRTETEPPGLLSRPAPSRLVALRPRAVHALSSTWTKRLSMTSWRPAKVSHGHSRHLAPPWLEFLPQTRTVDDAAHADGPHQPT